MQERRFRLLCIASLLSVMLGVRVAPAATPEAYDPWPGLVQDIFNNRPMNDGAGVIAIEMPYRAEDAAIVPVTLRTKLSPGDSRRSAAATAPIASSHVASLLVPPSRRVGASSRSLSSTKPNP